MYTNYMSEREDEDRKFAEWLKTLEKLPAEVNGDERWNAAVIMDALDYAHIPPAKNEK